MPATSDTECPADTAAESPVQSVAEVPTARPARYGKQLVAHLVHFATHDELVVRWRRADGHPGTVQGAP